MKIAVISDIHGNLYALQAVLSDIILNKVDMVYCAGDVVGYAPFPNEVIDLIRLNNIPSVLGNYDDTIANNRLVCGCDYKNEKAQALGEISIAWTRDHVTEVSKEYLRSLPSEIRFAAGQYEAVIVHGSPRRLNEYLHRDTPREYLLQLLNDSACDILLCGHTHIPYHLSPGPGKHVVNAGSAGKPKHGDPSATYVILNFTGGLTVSIRKVSYDVEAAARSLVVSGLPVEYADMLRQGTG